MWWRCGPGTTKCWRTGVTDGRHRTEAKAGLTQGLEWVQVCFIDCQAERNALQEGDQSVDNTYCHIYTLGVTEKLESFGPISCFLGI